MNVVNLIGNISTELELKQTQNGKLFCQFNLAVSRFGGDGADFIPVQVWNKVAENLVKFQQKGSKVAVLGRLNIEQYEKDGQKRTFAKVIASEIEFLGSKPQERTATGFGQGQKPQDNPFANYDWGMTPQANALMGQINDSDLPF